MIHSIKLVGVKATQIINAKKLVRICEAVKCASKRGDSYIWMEGMLLTKAEQIYLTLYGYRVYDDWEGASIEWGK
jgi:hypothetical protein